MYIQEELQQLATAASALIDDGEFSLIALGALMRRDSADAVADISRGRYREGSFSTKAMRTVSKRERERERAKEREQEHMRVPIK